MERRRFLERLLSGLVVGGLLLSLGCSKTEPTERTGNQEVLWQLITGQKQGEEPIELSYTKGTPALYRDASMGKPDASFVPKVSGG
jgi:hypothetical protein